MKICGTSLTLLTVGILAAASEFKKGSAFRLPRGEEPEGRPSRQEVQDLIDLRYSVEDILDVYPDHAGWPAEGVDGVYIFAIGGMLLLQNDDEGVARIVRD